MSRRLVVVLWVLLSIVSALGQDESSVAPTFQIIVPKVTGSTLEDARRKLEESGIEEFETVEVPQRKNPGQVLKQYPEPGGSLVSGGTVTLLVGVVPPQVVESDEGVASEPPRVEKDTGWTGWIITLLVTAWMLGFTRALWRAWRIRGPAPEVAFGKVRDLEME